MKDIFAHLDFPGSAMRIIWMPLLAVLVCGLMRATPAHAGDESGKVLGYIDSLPPETRLARLIRHRKVAERKKGIPIIVHRGNNPAWPENTMEAFKAALDYGADGLELDTRVSRDGVLYILHDDTLDRTTTGSGKARALTYYEMLQFSIKDAHEEETRIPTLMSVLYLIRERGALIHWDIKESELEDRIIEVLEDADMMDHVVEVNGNTPKLRNHPKVNLIPYKGWWPKTVDECREWAQQGTMGICDDSRAPAQALGREYKPVPLPKGIYAWWTNDGIVSLQSGRR